MAVVIPFELQPQASINRLVELVAPDMERVNAAILARTGSQVTMIPEVANHLINSGGKRLRPMLTLAMAQLSGYTGEGHIKLAAAVEFMHTATLLHDDVVDESEMRRGKLAARMLWGNEASVLVGDFLLGQAFRMMVDVGNLRALDILSQAATVIAEGEVMQLAAAKNTQTTEDEYLVCHPRQDRGIVRRRLRGRAGAGRTRQGRSRGLPFLRHESRHSVPAGRRCARLRRQVREARQECRRRFPRRQDHAAGGAVVPPRHRRGARVLDALPRTGRVRPTTISTAPSP